MTHDGTIPLQDVLRQVGEELACSNRLAFASVNFNGISTDHAPEDQRYIVTDYIASNLLHKGVTILGQEFRCPRHPYRFAKSAHVPDYHGSPTSSHPRTLSPKRVFAHSARLSEEALGVYPNLVKAVEEVFPETPHDDVRFNKASLSREVAKRLFASLIYRNDGLQLLVASYHGPYNSARAPEKKLVAQVVFHFLALEGQERGIPLVLGADFNVAVPDVDKIAREEEFLNASPSAAGDRSRSIDGMFYFNPSVHHRGEAGSAPLRDDDDAESEDGGSEVEGGDGDGEGKGGGGEVEGSSCHKKRSVCWRGRVKCIAVPEVDMVACEAGRALQSFSVFARLRGDDHTEGEGEYSQVEGSDGKRERRRGVLRPSFKLELVRTFPKVSVNPVPDVITRKLKPQWARIAQNHDFEPFRRILDHRPVVVIFKVLKLDAHGTAIAPAVASMDPAAPGGGE